MHWNRTLKLNKLMEIWVESVVAGFFVFSPIRLMGYFRLCRVTVKEEKSYCENTNKPAIQVPTHDPLIGEPLTLVGKEADL